MGVGKEEAAAHNSGRRRFKQKQGALLGTDFGGGKIEVGVGKEEAQRIIATGGVSSKNKAPCSEPTLEEEKWREKGKTPISEKREKRTRKQE